MRILGPVFTLLIASATFFVPRAHAEIRLPAVLSDHAVLQREAPIHLWGWSSPAAHLTIHFHAQTLSTTANALGEWSTWLMPERAGGPYTLTLDGGAQEGTAQITDLLVGDVWLASGQSNMEMPLKGFSPDTFVKDSKAEIAAANNPQLRLLVVAKKSSDIPQDDIQGTWTLCTPETAQNFSAVAYFFGRAIAAGEHVPIGLIDSSWGGTPADSWVSLNTLGNSPALLPAFASRAVFTDEQRDQRARMAAEDAEDAAAKAAGKPLPQHSWHPDVTAWLPAGLYNGMIAPLTGVSLKGFLWYQGESNSGHGRAPYYGTLFPALITDWRMHFAQGDLPFLFVQISSFNSPAEDWPTVRDAQRRTLRLADTAMVVSTDVGNPTNVHPADKQTVGARLALAARSLAYGEPQAYAPPLFREATEQTGAIRVWFDHAQGLTAHDKSGEPGKSIPGFEVAGGDHHFVPATATVETTSEGDTVLVSAPSVPTPVYVRYDWTSVTPPPLYNAAGLPLSTFTSEPAAP
jgi:sialate O-acetylesterase